MTNGSPIGSRSVVFGYMNRNWQEGIDVPVGPGNYTQPEPPDRGQPTHFLPRRNRLVFKVAVPSAFTDATLGSDSEVDDVVSAPRPARLAR